MKIQRRTYTLPETAAVLGIGEDVLRRLVRAGSFPIRPLNLGDTRRIVFPRAVIDEYAAHGAVEHARSA